jgi:hypothetical protein
VHGEQRVRRRLAGIAERLVEAQARLVEHDAARERIAVGVQAVDA